ncbi:MAG TPA: GNAT family N-acetyltransferase [Chitinophagaceae bacterium]|nr:GNAT family N-acetyltransferase [Chitinophagaceae bacterium]
MNKIRLATTADASAMLEIYKPFITGTPVTFETDIPSLSSFEQRIQTYMNTWPWLVYESDGVVAGYAYAARHRERAAYQWCVESSVYVHSDFQKRGIATLLYNTLFKILKRQGFINVYAVITLPNEKSVSFHTGFGFAHFADYKNIGYKMGKWHTVGWWELQLNEYPADPHEPVKLPLIDNLFLQEVLTRS